MDQKQYARTQRQNKPTTEATINDSGDSTRYKRQKETKNALEYIDGGEKGALYGAWDFLCRFATTELMEKLIIGYRRGKFIQKNYGKFY